MIERRRTGRVSPEVAHRYRLRRYQVPSEPWFRRMPSSVIASYTVSSSADTMAGISANFALESRFVVVQNRELRELPPAEDSPRPVESRPRIACNRKGVDWPSPSPPPPQVRSPTTRGPASCKSMTLEPDRHRCFRFPGKDLSLGRLS